MLEVAGTDATSAFEDVGHSEDAREILHAYLIGVLEGAPSEEPATAKPQKPSVHVVRRQPVDKPQTHEKLLSTRTELALLATAAAGLTWTVASLRSTPTNKPSPSQLSGVGSGHGGFLEGFLMASALAGAVGVASARYLSKAASFGSGFSSYAPYMPSDPQRPSAFHPAGVLTPSDYRKYKLRRKEELSDGIYRFVFDLPSKHSILGLPIGQHVAVRGVVNDSTVVRSYTPVSNNRDLGRLELLIRVYPKGQLGNYLKALNVGEEADIRGPKGAMRYRKGMCKAIGLVGGGTGITPLFQIIRAICEDKTDNTKVSLVYGNRSESDIMLREQLDRFARVASDKFKVFYVLDHPGEGWKGGRGYVSKDLLAERMPMPEPGRDIKIMLCGPPGMVMATKNNLVELGFEAPGAVGKMSDQVFCF